MDYRKETRAGAAFILLPRRAAGRLRDHLIPAAEFKSATSRHLQVAHLNPAFPAGGLGGVPAFRRATIHNQAFPRSRKDSARAASAGAPAHACAASAQQSSTAAASK